MSLPSSSHPFLSIALLTLATALATPFLLG